MTLTSRYAWTATRVLVSTVLLAVLLSKVDLTSLWGSIRGASMTRLAEALLIYCINVLVSIWRWHLLLDAQRVTVPTRVLLRSQLVALFANNFLPTNIGGDVIRIRDTARAARSKTVATGVVLMDRVIGLLGLLLVAAAGATLALGRDALPRPVDPTWVWVGFVASLSALMAIVGAPERIARLLRPIAIVHPWVEARIQAALTTLGRWRDRPRALVLCFVGAVVVQALVVAFYVAVARALSIAIDARDVAIIAPLSLLIQLVPISINGFGVREATFSYYFSQLGLPIESAVLMSLVGTALIMAFSLSGAVAYAVRRPTMPEVALDAGVRERREDSL